VKQIHQTFFSVLFLSLNFQCSKPVCNLFAYIQTKDSIHSTSLFEVCQTLQLCSLVISTLLSIPPLIFSAWEISYIVIVEFSFAHLRSIFIIEPFAPLLAFSLFIVIFSVSLKLIFLILLFFTIIFFFSLSLNLLMVLSVQFRYALPQLQLQLKHFHQCYFQHNRHCFTPFDNLHHFAFGHLHEFVFLHYFHWWYSIFVYFPLTILSHLKSREVYFEVICLLFFFVLFILSLFLLTLLFTFLFFTFIVL